MRNWDARAFETTAGFRVLVLLVLWTLALTIPARICLAEEIDSAPELKESKTAALLDSAGNVLYAKDGEAEMPPASTTKVMTAMVALDSGHDLSEVVTLVEEDLGDGGQLADYGTGDTAPLGELLGVMLIYSGNDAAYNVARFVAGSEEEFANLMNEKAKSIGMEHTHFVNSHGMDVDGHYSCAVDLARMGRYAMQHYPFICQTVVKNEVTTTVRGYPETLKATDRLLGLYQGIRGVKTGAVIDNYTFVGASGRGPIQLYSAVMGCTTVMGRFDDTAALMDWAYGLYKDVELGNPDWAVRLQPFAFDLGRKTVLSALDVATGTRWPTLGDVSYKNVLVRPNRLLEPGTVYGWTDWYQADRHIATSYSGTEEQPVQVSSWPTFTLPLFANTQTLSETDHE